MTSLINAHRDLGALMPQLHLPVQSGSDRILAAMNRKHTHADYRDVIARLRDACPDIALTSDFIVGFPGETEEDFRDTLKLAEAVKISPARISSNIQRVPGTPAAELNDQVSEEENPNVWYACRMWSKRDRARHSMLPAAARRSTFCSKSRAACLARLVGRPPYLLTVQVDGAGKPDWRKSRR